MTKSANPNNEKLERTCDNCVYYDDTHSAKYCKRYPPTVSHYTSPEDIPQHYSEWPYVDPSWTCGEFKSK